MNMIYSGYPELHELIKPSISERLYMVLKYVAELCKARIDLSAKVESMDEENATIYVNFPFVVGDTGLCIASTVVDVRTDSIRLSHRGPGGRLSEHWESCLASTNDIDEFLTLLKESLNHHVAVLRNRAVLADFE